MKIASYQTSWDVHILSNPYFNMLMWWSKSGNNIKFYGLKRGLHVMCDED